MTTDRPETAADRLAARLAGRAPLARDWLDNAYPPPLDEHDRPEIAARGRVIRLGCISRALVQANRSAVFVFGDNMAGTGFGGQAAEMRGEPNVIGVPTKWRPLRQENAYFTDADFKNGDVRHALMEAFTAMRDALAAGRNVVIPADGLGTGLAELPTRAPAIHAYIQNAIAELERTP